MGEDRGGPSKYELGERLARVEEKQDHVVDGIGRIEGKLDEELAAVEETVEQLETRNAHLWLIYRGGKWFIALVAGSSLLATAVTTLL